ncbi:persulfide dioxygenase ETHE1, mitochondrial [Lepeophtheirus salmonis]|uniref:persulfide dioxygenase ETHE1, mitochondrial n=1 Tax=Lepeophtheirus salmonis TaxID=72036 RepID=UPI001AEB2C23|nr:persulfide dioxygenase ETHE1, mitochondrial-like [Lepeophtheirus salmonis]
MSGFRFIQKAGGVFVKNFIQQHQLHQAMSPLIAPKWQSNVFFRQLFDQDSWTYTYLLADIDSKEALLIDPVIEKANRDLDIIKDYGLTLKYCLNTHVHADHITGSGLLKKLSPGVKSIISKQSGADADIHVEEGDKIQLGVIELDVHNTPGHTNGCITFVSHDSSCAFTGDAILIRGCGRTDFQQGDASRLYHSVWDKILSLPDNYLLYPAHDYQGRLFTSVKEEKMYNKRLTKSEDEFIKIMDTLGLAYPKKIDVALPANLKCGLDDLPKDLEHLVK